MSETPTSTHTVAVESGVRPVFSPKPKRVWDRPRRGV